MNSRLYEGHVFHERSRPVRNRFRYRVWLLYLDLAEIEDLDRTVRPFRHNRFGWASFYDRDHGPRDGSTLRPWIDDLLGRVGIALEGGPVRLLSFARGLWFRFYPVTFWYCFHADGSLRAILAEVHNTFGGRHNYLLHRSGAPMAFKEDLFVDKVFHVSPFIAMDARYRFLFTEPSDTVSASLYDTVEGEPLLVAAVSATALPFDTPSLAHLVRRYQAMPLRIWLYIHFQAIRLIAKRVRFYHDPGLPEEETTLDPQR